MSIKTSIAVLFAAGLATACAPLQGGGDLAAPGTPAVSGLVTSAGVQYPLPRGEWQPVLTLTNDAGTVEVLADITAGVISRVAILGDGGGGVDPCASDADTLAAAAAAPGDCWQVRPVTVSAGGLGGAVSNGLIAFAEREGAFLPRVLLGAAIEGPLGPTPVARYGFYWNPDILAPAPGTRTWTAQDWSPVAVAGDPARQIVADRVAGWAARWRDRLLTGAAAS
ncbi:MAG: hypothetical protein AAFW69_02415 [Pseudomonadota bacterium]